MKKKALTTTFLGVTGLITGLAHAGASPPGGINVQCGGSDGDISYSWENDSCSFEVDVRCDGDDSEDEYGYGAVCIDWEAFGDDEFIRGTFFASWADAEYGCSGFLPPIGGDLSEYGTGAWAPAMKIEKKVTSEAKGNGKKNHNGQKGDSGITVEFEVKRVECAPED
jgi:hypothetical protein